MTQLTTGINEFADLLPDDFVQGEMAPEEAGFADLMPDGFVREVPASEISGLENFKRTAMQSVVNLAAGTAGSASPEVGSMAEDMFSDVIGPSDPSSVSGFLGSVTGNVASALALSLATSPLGAASVFGVSAAGGQRADIARRREAGQEIGVGKEVATALAIGSIEVATEFIGIDKAVGLGKVVFRAVNNSVERGTKETIKEVVSAALQSSVVNASEELVNQIGQNAVNKLSGIAPNISLLQGAGLSALSGAVAGPGITAGAALAQSVSPQTQQPSIEDQIDVTTPPSQAPERQEAQQRVQEGTVQEPGQATVQETQAAQGVDAGVEAAPGIIEDVTGVEDVLEDFTDPEQAIEKPVGQRSPEGTTSARRVDIDQDRSSFGQDVVPSPDRKSFAQFVDSARKNKIPEKALRIAESVIQSPRALSAEETAGLVDRAVSLKNEHRNLVAAVVEADDAQTAIISEELQRIEQEFDTLTTAVRFSGTEKGRALVSQKITLNDSFDLLTVKARAKSAKGLALTAPQVKVFEDLVKRLEVTESRLSEAQERLTDLEVQGSISRSAKRRGQQSKSELDSELNGLKAETARLLRAGCLDS